MNVLLIKPHVSKFEITGKDNEGAYILSTQYKYRLAPHHPEHKSYLSVWADNVFNSLNGSNIIFNVEIHIQFDLNGKKPTVEQLLTLAGIANKEMNRDLRAFTDTKTDLNPLTIAPINVEETVPILEQIILGAYPEN